VAMRAQLMLAVVTLVAVHVAAVVGAFVCVPVPRATALPALPRVLVLTLHAASGHSLVAVRRSVGVRGVGRAQLAFAVVRLAVVAHDGPMQSLLMVSRVVARTPTLSHASGVSGHGGIV
jgi:hypothetical protein